MSRLNEERRRDVRPDAGVIDTHAHLEMSAFDRDRDAVVRRAQDAGVRYIVTVGTTLGECRKAIAIAGRYEPVYAVIGIHPHEVKRIDGQTYDTLRALAKSPKVVAYGEIGLDFFRNLSPRKWQIKRFEEQLEVADALGLPVVIHDREAHRETVDALKRWRGGKRGVIHCFSGDEAMAQECLDMGFYISIPGTVTFDKNERLRSVVRRLPLTSLLVETDCPYLTPVPNRGKRNEPSYVIYTARCVSEIKGLPFEEVARVTSDGAKALFGIG